MFALAAATPFAAGLALKTNPPAVVNAVDGFAPPVWLARESMIQLTKPIALLSAQGSEFGKPGSLPVERKFGAIDIETQNT